MTPAPAFRARFVNVTGLGPLTEIFPVRLSGRWGAVVLGGLLCLVGALFVVGALGYTLVQDNRLGPDGGRETLTTFTLPIAGTGLFLGAAGLVSLWKGYRNWNLAAALYRDGLAYSDYNGVRQFRWTDITSVKSNIKLEYGEEGISGVSLVYKMYDRDGKALELNDEIKNVGALVQKIQTAIYPHIYTEAAERFNSGKTVNFGKITIGQNGLEVGKRMIPWAEVGHIEFKKAQLHVVRNDKTRSRAATVAANAVPNFPVLIALVQQVSEARARRSG